MSREVFNPRPYQAQAIAWALDRPRCGLFLDMSLGKTACTLTAVEELIYERGEVSRVLVIAPPRVAAVTWPAEAAKWEHLQHLRVQAVNGTAKRRIEALAVQADVYTISRDLVTWLIDEGLFDFDMLIIDELSSFKSPKAKRFRKLRNSAKSCKRVIGLTGTPSPNGLGDLWAEVYMLDAGERLGKTVTAYRERYFTPGARRGMVVYEWRPKNGARDAIMAKLSDICITMKKEDYIDLPDKVFVDVPVELPPRAMKLYKDMERDSIIDMPDDRQAVALTAAAVGGKLQQLADGGVYLEDGSADTVHTAKLEALAELVEAAQGSPMLVFYAYRFERDAILEKFTDAVILDSQESIEAWNRGELTMAVAHPASVGHGLNLQHGGHIIVWYGLTWSLELYLQANDRLHRPGQQRPVMVYRLIAQGTIDDAVADAIERKDAGQSALIDYLSAKRRAFEMV